MALSHFFHQSHFTVTLSNRFAYVDKEQKKREKKMFLCVIRTHLKYVPTGYCPVYRAC